MIVTASGETIGAVSGGCLEADIVARSPGVLAAGRPELARYDTRVSDDVVLGLGLGCQGLIDVLLEPLANDSLNEAIAFYGRLRGQRDPVTVLTSLGKDPIGPPLGTRAVTDSRENLIEGDATLLAQQAAREVVRPSIPLVVCGAGTDAMPLVRLAKLMGWNVTVVDHRASFATAARFPDADALVCANLTQEEGDGVLATRITLDARTVAVVMAHSAPYDRAYLHAMLEAGVGYVGVLGPRRRTIELLGHRAPETGALPTVIHAPVGLDLGAETPEEIALSIVAEIAAVHAGREGGMLRERRGPIHDRPSHQVEVDA